VEGSHQARQALVDTAPRNGLERIQGDVRRFGWHGVRVKGREGGGGYLFTVGLWQTYRHPEIVLFAPEEDPSGMLKPLQRVCQAVSQNEVFQAEQTHPKLFDSFPGVFGVVDTGWYDQFLGAAVAYYEGEAFPALQLFWPDRQGLFPWEDDCAPSVRAWQPLLFEEAPSETSQREDFEEAAFEGGRPEGGDLEAGEFETENLEHEDLQHEEFEYEAPRPASDEDLQLRASDLFADLSDLDPGQVMKNWLWLIGEELSPLQVTIFGDVFLTPSSENQSSENQSSDGPVYFLDTGRGTLEEVAPDRGIWKRRLADPPAEWFHTGVLMDLLERGERPAKGRVFSWKVPLSAGGEEDADNTTVADARLHLGQTSRAAQAAQGSTET